MVVFHNNKIGNNYLVAIIIATYFKCDKVAAEDNPSLLEYDTIVFVVSNTGDEELPQPMEDYLYNLNIFNKKYIICEIGNYFGFEDYSGCKKVACKILDNLGWQRILDISFDSLPNLDLQSLNKWLQDNFPMK